MRPLFSTLALALSAATLNAQTVQFRIVERTGQAAVSSGDTVLDFAVQARVVGGGPTASLATFSFNILAPCEPDSSGTLSKLLISQADGTYTPNTTQTAGATVGRAGLASMYAYYARINPAFNGVINASAGGFTNGPYQEIGTVSGGARATGLLLIADTTGSGNPDTYSGSGTTAPLDPAIATQYLGAGETFVDIYRFKYTTTDLTVRNLQFTLNSVLARIGSTLVTTSGVWHVDEGPDAVTSVQPVTIFVGGGGGGSGGGICCDPNTGACTPAPQCGCTSGQFIAGGTCTPNACPQPGQCCQASGVCSLVAQDTCLFTLGGQWSAGSVCSPNPCPQRGACCDAITGACTFILQSACTGIWPGSPTCTPTPCPTTGACCAASTSCTITTNTACAAASGTFKGVTTTCGPAGNPTTCCPANFNQTGGLTVQDIFDFLSAWFASSTTADFDHNGQIQVFDIFAFLQSWFTGCN